MAIDAKPQRVGHAVLVNCCVCC